MNAVLQFIDALSQSINATLQSTNAIVQFMNAELQSMNATLQSTNALLQFMNAELQFINATLQSTNAILHSMNAVLQLSNAILQLLYAVLQSLNAILQSINTTLQSRNAGLNLINTILQLSIAIIQPRNAKIRDASKLFKMQHFRAVVARIKVLRTIFRRTDLCAEASLIFFGMPGTEEKIVFLASFCKLLIKRLPGRGAVAINLIDINAPHFFLKSASCFIDLVFFIQARINTSTAAKSNQSTIQAIFF